MTRKEASFIFANIDRRVCDDEMNEALDMAIQALEKEPCEDCISREAVLSKIKEVCFSKEWVQFRANNGSNGQRDFLINYIEQLSPVTPQPKTDIMDKAIDLYNALARNNSSGCELNLTEGYHMIVTISRTVEFPEFEPIKAGSEVKE